MVVDICHILIAKYCTIHSNAWISCLSLTLNKIFEINTLLYCIKKRNKHLLIL